MISGWKLGWAVFSAVGLAGCDTAETRQVASDGGRQESEFVGRAVAKQQNLPFLALPTLVESYDQKIKGEFETSAAHRARVRSMDDAYRAKNPFVTVVPVFPHRWAYDADSSEITYSAEGIGSLTAATDIKARGRQAWIAQDDVEHGIGVNTLVVTQACAAVFPADAQLARELKSQDARYYLAIALSVPAMSAAVSSNSYNEPTNLQTADWAVQQLEAQALSVHLLSSDGLVIAKKSCELAA